MTASVIFLMADEGHDPTETAIPWSIFKEAGFQVSFATENGKAPTCDARMLTGWTQKLLGANKKAIDAYSQMIKSSELQTPLAWSKSGFTINDYNVVFLPGGHEKSVRQQIDSKVVQQQLSTYWSQIKKPSQNHVAAICHGVLALSEANQVTDGQARSLVWDVKSTALPGTMESFAYHGTRLFLGDYYKTYGAGSDNVETVVRGRMRDPASQWSHSLSNTPFVVVDEIRNYYSGRFPPDAELLAKTVVDNVKASLAF